MGVGGSDFIGYYYLARGHLHPLGKGFFSSSLALIVAWFGLVWLGLVWYIYIYIYVYVYIYLYYIYIYIYIYIYTYQ